MHRNFSYISFSLFLAIACTNQVNAGQKGNPGQLNTCPKPSEVAKIVNEHRNNLPSLQALDEFKVGLDEATKIDKDYVLLSLATNPLQRERVRSELGTHPVENLQPMFREPLDSTDSDVSVLHIPRDRILKLEIRQSVCGYYGAIGEDSVGIYVGKVRKPVK